MPRFPDLSPSAHAIRAMTFAAFGERIASLRAEGRLIPLHLGDTYVPPPEAVRRAVALDRLETHLYGPTAGLPELTAALAVREGVEAQRILISPGATGGLTQAAHTLFAPGEEVIVLTPSWPLIFGILQSMGVRPVEAPAGPDAWPEADPGPLLARIEALISSRTAGIYYCDPNNPVGFVYPAAHVAGMRELARRHDLWLLVDEAYHDLVYDGSRPADPAAPERTVRVRSFSKSWCMAGHRIGYLVGPPDLSSLLLRVGTHQTYHAGISGQRMALAALEAGDGFIDRLRRTYTTAAAQASAALRGRVPFHEPQAGYYLFLDLRPRCADASAVLELLRRLTETGVTLAPGGAFGDQFDRFVRLCFTAVPPERLSVGLDALADFLG